MEKGLKGYRPLLLLLLCGGMTLKAAAQAAITDPLNTAQSTLTAGNTAATVKQVTESVNRLQTAKCEPGKLKAANSMETSITLSIRYILIEVDGEPLIELNKIRGKYAVGGVDQLAALEAMC